MMTWQTHLDKVDRPSIEDLQKAGNKARSEVKKAKEKLRLAEQWFDRVAMAYSIEMMHGGVK
jgi:hypothetical protein|tara:strand:- start:33 stop:218 length:186 start_codon:yes stop_codon:yes gene_type:complete